MGAPASILSLLPAGLTPISVFPPYSVPRNFEAESIIFAEDPEILQLEKRSIWKRRKRITLRRAIKNLSNKFMKNIMCLQTRLYGYGHPYEIHHFRSRTSHLPHYNDKNINSIDDCIDGIQEPLYGFRTKIFFLKDSPCVLGSTCDSISSIGTDTFVNFYMYINN